jgi:heat shock protein HtpX
LYHLGNAIAEPWRHDRSRHSPAAAAGGSVTLALVPSALSALAPRYSASGAGILVELVLPSSHPGLAFWVRIHGHTPDILRLHRQLNRTEHRWHSGTVMAGMLLLGAVCGWLAGGNDGARGAVAGGGTISPDEMEISPRAMEHRFGARLLSPAAFPVIFEHLREICHRAGLPRQPYLFYLPAPLSMNAYALGNPERSAIVLTQGLLERMTPAEVAGILAHEVAHIRNNDALTMTWATKLQRAVATASLAALAPAHGRGLGNAFGCGPAASPHASLALFLSNAPAIGQLLYLALSRVRELDADALALELIDDPHALVNALHKLECFHSGSTFPLQATIEDGLVRLLRSHPATSERVGRLLRLAL